MTIKELPLAEYEELFKLLKQSLRPHIDLHPWMTEKERIKAIEEAYNPPMPKFIDYFTEDGLVRYVCKD